jgi:putative spermidine/putrescine transport system substrate-binding protein
MSDVPEDSTRRQSLKTLAVAAVSAAAICQAPYVFAKQRTKLRVLGTHVTLQEELRHKAMDDLGIDLTFEAKGSAAVLHKASVNPRSFDLYEQWSNSIRPLWSSGSLQAI